MTQADLDDIDVLIASAVATSRTADGKSTTFVTAMDALLARRAFIVAQIGGTPRRATVGYYSPDSNAGDGGE